jgi:hypothetical protein
MPTGMINKESRQVVVRVKLTHYPLMERDAKIMSRKTGKKCGVSTVNNDILDQHYAPELAKAKTKKTPKKRR